MLQTLNTLAGKISPHNGSESGRLINNNNNNTYNNNDKYMKLKRKMFSGLFHLDFYTGGNGYNEFMSDISNHQKLSASWNSRDANSVFDNSLLLVDQRKEYLYKISQFDQRMCDSNEKLSGNYRRGKQHLQNLNQRSQSLQNVSVRIKGEKSKFSYEPFNNSFKKYSFDSAETYQAYLGNRLCKDGTEKLEKAEAEMGFPQSLIMTSSVGNTENKELGFKKKDFKASQRLHGTEPLTPATPLSLETSFYKEDVKRRNSQLINIFKQINKDLADEWSPGIQSLKDSMRIKHLATIFDENFILEQIDDYKDYRKKEKALVAKQVAIINKHIINRFKKPLQNIKPKKKLVFRKKRKVKSVIHVGKELEKSDTESDTRKSNISEIQEEMSGKSVVCCVSEKSISCPSETDSETACNCVSSCTCNEYARFKKFMYRKQEILIRDLADKVCNASKRNSISNEWYQLKNLDDCTSEWSDETSLEVTSTSSSSCTVVRRCHCSSHCCGCDQYRDYLLYKLYQVRARKRRRNNKRAHEKTRLESIVDNHYEEDEYNKKVRDFIYKHYVKPNEKEEKVPKCTCGLYYCECTPCSDEKISSNKIEKPIGEQSFQGNKETNCYPSTSSILKIQSDHKYKISYDDDERKKVRFGSESSEDFESIERSQLQSRSCLKVTSKSDTRDSTPDETQERGKLYRKEDKRCEVLTQTSYTSYETETKEIDPPDIYKQLSTIMDQNDSFLYIFLKNNDLQNEIQKENEENPTASNEENEENPTALNEENEENPTASNDSSCGSFDFKKHLSEGKCNCDNYMKYYNFKKKIRRLSEKKDPLNKYYRKRAFYLSNMEKTEKLLDNTSSETDCPVSGPLMQKCQKYMVIGDIERRKIFKRKSRKAEKKVLLDIIKKGCHLYPCECMGLGRQKEKTKTEQLPCECEDCGCLCKGEEEPSDIIKIKTKIEPSIELGELDDKDCILGTKRIFPECPECRRIKTGHINVSDKVDQQSVTPGTGENNDIDSKEFLQKSAIPLKTNSSASVGLLLNSSERPEVSSRQKETKEDEEPPSSKKNLPSKKKKVNLHKNKNKKSKKEAKELNKLKGKRGKKSKKKVIKSEKKKKLHVKDHAKVQNDSACCNDERLSTMLPSHSTMLDASVSIFHLNNLIEYF